MAPQAEERALLAIVRRLLGGDAPAEKVTSPALVELLRRHHLRPLAHSLGTAGLVEASQECSLLAAFHHKLLTSVGADFAAREIRWSVIKGAAYAWSLYEEPGLRPMSDVDLLVEQAEFERACECLLEAGFVERGVSKRTRHAQTFFRADHEIVDLHRSILQPLRSNSQMAGVWRRVKGSDAFPGYVELDKLDLCCVHVAHMARHELVVPLVSYVDLHRLVASLSQAQSSRLPAALREWRLELAFEAATELTSSLAGGPGSRSLRMRLVLPTVEELAIGAHHSRATQLAKKLALFPKDSLALSLGWAARSAEDQLMRFRSR